MIILLLLLSLSQAFELQIVSPQRADLLVSDDAYPNVTRVQRCYPEGCELRRNYSVVENVILFGRSLELEKAGNLTVWADIYLASGLFRNATNATAQIVPPPAPPAPANPLWYLLWTGLFVASFPLALILVK